MLAPKTKDKNSGFTLLEMMISTAVILIMLIFVLANYRTAGSSGEISYSVEQILNGFRTAQSKGVSGNLVEDPLSPPDRIYPNQGYAIYFEEASPNRFSIYGLHGVDKLDEEIFQSPVVFLVSLCGLPTPAPVPVPPPCSGAWDNNIASAEIIFNLAGDVISNFKDSANSPLSGFDYFGGIIEHQKTGQQAYFYVSLITGIASGDTL